MRTRDLKPYCNSTTLPLCHLVFYDVCYLYCSAIKKQTSIEFQQTKVEKTKKEIPFNEYPTTKKVYNSMLDIKRKIHLFTKTSKSKCYHAAGWYVMYQSEEPVVVFCPKYIFIQRYEYEGPYKTEDEAKNLINI